jgi:hypothetical protein
MIVNSKDLSLLHDPAKHMLGAGTKSLSECFRAGEIFSPRNNWNYWNGWNHWNRLLSGVFQAMNGLDRQLKRKFLSDNPRRFYGIEAS